MRKVIYLVAGVAFVIELSSCNKDDNHDISNAKQNIELRATTLGYSDVASYTTSVAEQCSEGNHDNCDVKTDGTHNACAYVEHSGTKHNGTSHNGSQHGMHDNNGHSHNSHEKEKYHN